MNAYVSDAHLSRESTEQNKKIWYCKFGGGISMDETFNWFTKADLSKYEDKYVAIVDKEVVYADEDPEVAYTHARRKYPDKEIVLWKVLPHEIYIF